MKKRGILVAIMICAITACIALVGCGSSGGSSTAQSDPADSFKGTWEAVSMESSDGTVVTSDDMQYIKDMGLNVTLTLASDKTFALDIMGEVFNGTWSASDASKITLTAEGSSLDATFADNQLTLDADGSKMVFAKTDAAVVDTAPTSSTSTTSSSSTSSSSSAAGTVTALIGTQLANDSTCTIEVVSLATDDWGDPGFNLVITNNSASAIYVYPEYGTWSVNGKMLDPVLAETIQPGMYVETFLYFSSTDVGGGAEALTNVAGDITVVDNATYANLATYKFAY